jgi:superfamily I DNA/RNA helicase
MEKLEPSPIANTANQDEQIKIKGQQKIRQELQSYTVQQALEQAKQHISFVQKEEIPHHLILTTIDNAKSQEFDTVFFLGADALGSEERFYVGISRAKQRLFLLVDAQYTQNNRYIKSNHTNNIYVSEDDLLGDLESPF